jgi:P-type Mg2+ transporter
MAKSNRNADGDTAAKAQPMLSTDELLAIPVEEFYGKLETSPQGLPSEEASRRLDLYGFNELAKRKKHSSLVQFLMNFKSPLVIILMVAGLISGLLGEWANTVIIYTIVFLSVILDFYQESKAEKAAETLKEKVTTTATVLRDDVKKEVKLRDIVPGDIIYLSAGDIIPADARVISAKDLFVNQSSLTGESFPFEKTNVPLNGRSASISDWSNFLFMGTSIVSGTATAIVVRTGGNTEYGKIARKLVEASPETEFERGIKSFGFLIMQITILLVLFVFLINALIHPDTNGILNALLFSVALAVGLTPELLPMIITVNLSRGAISMSKKGVIVKRLNSIENFGSMNVLCTDKTGTLTENKITLVLHVDVDGKDDNKVLLYSYLNSFYQTGLKSPLDEAILNHEGQDISGFQKIDEVPFDFVRRRVSVAVEKEHQRFFISKGAPEEIVKVCSFCEIGGLMLDFMDEIRKRAENKYLDLSSEGFRVLGVSYKKLREEKVVYSVNDESDMVFLGFVAFLDPPKETAKESLKLLSNAGIELKILTGDNELVTRKTCEQLGFEVKGVALGSEISQMHDDALANVVEEANVFARVTPVQKDRIINLLKGNGHVVGFMGDGINDAPSLKTSDVGVSVDNAVDVAKESADIILLKNDLTVLAEGVLEGRKTFGNTMKYIMMGVSSNFGNMFSVAGASLVLPFLGYDFLPMLPIQILLNNLLYDLSQSTITTDNVDPEYVEKPKRWDIGYIRNFMIYLGPVSSLFDFLTFFAMLFIFFPMIQNVPLGYLGDLTQYHASLFQTAWFIESLTTQTLVIFAIRTRKSPFWKSKPGKLLTISSLAIIAAAIAIPYTFLGDKYFQFVPPTLLFFVFLSILVVAYMVLAEIVKRWFFKHHAYRVEQVLIPKRRTTYLSRNARLVQDIVAAVCLRAENEISFDGLIDDLSGSLSYPIDSDQVLQNLQHLRRGGLISVDWHQRVIKREGPLKEYVNKRIASSETWPMIFDDWLIINRVITEKHGAANSEFQELLKPRQY